MRLVIIESPYAGTVELHVAYARAALRDSLSRGEAPIAPHLLYPQILDDNDPAQRAHGIAAGLAWRKACVDQPAPFHPVPALPAFYVDLGWSSGMRKALDIYQREGITTETRRIFGGAK